ncbi:MAG: YqhA family protein [Actinobacteria bacterium]|nr:YqhA family protein [Actinomycetota bacterium]
MNADPPEEDRRPSGLVGQMVASSRFFVLLATISLFLAFMAVMVSTIIESVNTVLTAVFGEGMTQNELIGKLIKQADYALLATVLYVLALGLYSLFVDDRIPMPGWLRISDLGQLKELLAGVVVVAIAVIFLGEALTWDGNSDLLAPGLASAAVIAALALFLWQATRDRQLDREAEPPSQADGDHGDNASGVA